MSKSKKLLVLFTFFVVSLPVLALVLNTHMVKADEQVVVNPVTILNVAHVDVNGMTRNELFDFVTNIENDSSYWLGVDETFTVQEGDSQDKTGTVYVQRGFFGGVPFDTTITITNGKNHKFITLEGSSPALNYTATYTFQNVGEDTDVARFTTSSVITGVGLTPEYLSGFIQASFGNLLTTLNKTGSVVVDQSEVL